MDGPVRCIDGAEAAPPKDVEPGLRTVLAGGMRTESLRMIQKLLKERQHEAALTYTDEIIAEIEATLEGLRTTQSPPTTG